jgi:hypothetical protein
MLASQGILSISNKEEYEKRMKQRLTRATLFDLLLSKDSPIEEMVFWVEMYLPERVHTHLSRHKEIAKYVATSRVDIQGSTPLVDGMRWMSLRLNAKRLIEISELRLCYKSWHETIKVWKEVVRQCILIEPLLMYVLEKPCVKYGYCNKGRKTCGDKTFPMQYDLFKNDIAMFLSNNKKGDK